MPPKYQPHKEPKYPQHQRRTQTYLTQYETVVEFIWSNRVASVYGESGSTICYTHTKNRKDIINALEYNIVRDFPLYTDVDVRRLNIKESKWVGPPK